VVGLNAARTFILAILVDPPDPPSRSTTALAYREDPLREPGRGHRTARQSGTARRRIKPIVADRIPLAEAREAHRLLEGGGIGGKMVLVTDG
jgi:NADPH:quinone reductase-like Zn-dependent oxidoreductase